MVKKVVWSTLAQNQFKSILEYWIKHNQSANYSEKLLLQFTQRIQILKRFPLIGISTQLLDVKFTIVEYYRLYYRYNKNTLQIIYVWDTRQDPINNKYS